MYVCVLCVCICEKGPTNSKGHKGMDEATAEVSSDRLVKPGFEPVIPKCSKTCLKRPLEKNT